MRPPRRGPARELALGRRTAHVTIRPRLGRLRLLCHGCHERAAGRPTCSSRSRPPIKGPAAIAACLAGGDQHQRHVDLLAVPLRRRHGRIPRRHGTGTHEAAELRGRRAIANAQLAYQDYERCSPPRGGPGCRRPEPGRNGRCGRRRRPRTRPIPHPLGHAWAWTSGQPRAPAVSPGHLNPVVYVAKCWVPAVPIDWFFPDAEAVIGVRLGITVETTENQGGWEPSCVSRAARSDAPARPPVPRRLRASPRATPSGRRAGARRARRPDGRAAPPRAGRGQPCRQRRQVVGMMAGLAGRGAPERSTPNPARPQHKARLATITRRYRTWKRATHSLAPC